MAFRRIVAAGLVLAAGATTVAAAAGSRSVLRDTRFSSHRYPYSLVVPAGWKAHAAAATSPANSAYFPTADAPTVDSFTSPPQDNWIIAVSATQMNSGLTLKAWSVGTPKRIQLTLGCKPKGPTAGTIGGVRAAVYTMPPSCGTGWAGLDYVVARAGYGYDIQENSQPAQQAQHRAAFAQILRTFKFTR